MKSKVKFKKSLALTMSGEIKIWKKISRSKIKKDF